MAFEIPRYYAPDFTQEKFRNTPDVRWAAAPRDGVAPEYYHSTSMYPEYFKLEGVWTLAEESALLAKSCGAREGFGTDMRIFAPAFAKEKGLNWESTQDPARVLEFLRSGQGVVIGNTAGNREDWIGVFSDSRHYIVVVSAEGNTVQVWDPLLAPGRYDTPGRAGKVRLDGFNAYADFSIIIGDCGSRPFYLFWKA